MIWTDFFFFFLISLLQVIPSGAGVGVTNHFLIDIIFPIFQHCQNESELFNWTAIFAVKNVL